MKNRLYDCMQKTMNRCQGSTEVMAMGGYDHESLKKGIDVLCKDVNGKNHCALKSMFQINGVFMNIQSFFFLISL